MKVVRNILLVGAVLFGGLTSVQANELGIGLATPAPTGISLKLWFDKTNAVDILGSWSLNDEKFYVHMNYLTHDYSKFALGDDSMAFYYGFGARLKEEQGDDKDTILGMRIPFGISYFLLSAPFEVFGELAPRVDITPDTNFGMDVMIGIRYRLGHHN